MTQLEWLRFVAKCLNEACAILERENADALQSFACDLQSNIRGSREKQGTP